MLLDFAALFSAFIVVLWGANQLSYRWIKNRVLRERVWDFNICCGTTDGGGINADIVEHADVPRFQLIRDVNQLPHADRAFKTVLCSHTLEHVDDPEAMFNELKRVGERVTVLVPPLWDLGAALNPIEHRVIFLTLRSRHDDQLPPFVRFTAARWLQRHLGQRIDADARGQRKADASVFIWRPLFEALMPLAWGSAALLLYSSHAVGPLAFVLAVIVWRLSRRQQPLLSSDRPDAADRS